MAQNWLAGCNPLAILGVVIVIVFILIVVFVWLCSAFGESQNNGVLAAVKNNRVAARPIPRNVFSGHQVGSPVGSPATFSPPGQVADATATVQTKQNTKHRNNSKRGGRCSTDVEPLKSRSSLTFTSPSSMSHRSSR